MMVRMGAGGSKGTGGQHLPFSRAVQAGGWLYVSGQTPMIDGEIVEGSINDQARLAISNCLEIVREAGYGVEHVVHVSVILTDARYFQPFNKVFEGVFSGHPPARSAPFPVWWLTAKWKSEWFVTRIPLDLESSSMSE